MRINNNISALNAWRNLTATDNNMGKSLERLSSGFRINRAADDAAGLAISEKMRGQIKGLNQAVRNAQDAISLIQTAEGSLNETHSILQRMRELAVQAASDTATDSDRGQIQKEMDNLAKEITRISNTSEFNTKNLLAGGFKDQSFQIGANAGQNVTLSIGPMDAASLGVTSGRGAYTNPGDLVQSASLGAGATIESGDYTIEADVKTAAVKAEIRAFGLAVNNIVLEANAAGSESISLNIVAPGAGGATPLGVTVAGNAITVNLEWDGAAVVAASYTEIVDAINNNVDAAKLVTASIEGNGATTTNASLAAAVTSSSDGGVIGTNARVDFTLRDASGAVIETIANHDVGTPLAFAVSGLNATVNAAAMNKMGQDEVTKSNVEVVNSNSFAATTGQNGEVITDAVAAKGILINTQETADKAITVINNALERVSGERSKLGALQNRLDHTIANLSAAAENLNTAESRIRDVDMAAEMVVFTRNQILLQAGMAMMAQANQKPQSVLQLLR